ncbi:MAG: hypothetical protein UZ21_OP11001001173 [Microgenomates bacterium OLB22]|nr:MAG: hypothetical protein UZ21_OP11001001173 [Microgenomates bacterium OLB22]
MIVADDSYSLDLLISRTYTCYTLGSTFQKEEVFVDVMFRLSRILKIPAEIFFARDGLPARVRLTPDDATNLYQILDRSGIAFQVDDNMVLRELDHPGLREFTMLGPLSTVRLYTSMLATSCPNQDRVVKGYMSTSGDVLVHLTDLGYIYIYLSYY